jgi:hypothetical protein
MANAEGFVTVFESSDAGTGDPAKTLWQFFVDTQAVTTANHFLAETVRLAIETNSRVQTTFNPADGNKLSQVRIVYEYGCEARRLAPCKPEPHE